MTADNGYAAPIVELPSELGAANGRNIVGLVFRRMYRLTRIGAANVPLQGRLIIAANHLGFLDGPLLFAAAPRPIHVMAKREVFVPPIDRLLTGVGQIPLDYESADRNAVAKALAVLSDGRALGIFPEAHRGKGDLAGIRHGVAYLHTRSNAPIVPAAIFGTRSTGMSKDGIPPLRSRMFVVFGVPFSIPALGDIDKRSTLAAVGESIRQRLADHLCAAIARTGGSLPADDVSPEATSTERSSGSL